MVDILLLQSVSYMAGAVGVCVAAIYYVINLRVQQTNMKETMLNRRATFANSLLQPIMSEEGSLKFLDLIDMRWSDFDDYVKKYDSAVNRENFAKRVSYWSLCDMIGYQYKAGIIDLETIYSVCGVSVLYTWNKFKPIIERYRDWEWAKDTYVNWENLANDLDKIMTERDSEYRRKHNTVEEVQAKGVPQ